MDADLADEWIFDSMKTYSSLFMYDLQQPITSADWISPQGLCVAVSHGIKHEVLELSLPDKLLSNKDQEGLVKDRDFRVETGGFMGEKVTNMSHVPNTRLIITSTELDNSIRVVQVGDPGSNLIKSKFKIENTSKQPESAVIGVLSDSHVVFGDKLSDVSLADINTGNVILSMPERTTKNRISQISTLDDVTFLVCERSKGHVYTIDVRDRKLVCNHSNDRVYENQDSNSNNSDSHSKTSDWTMCVSCDQKTVYQISNRGVVRQKDMRNFQDSIVMATDLSTDQNNFSIEGSPCGKYLSVAGFDGHLYIFSTNLTNHQSPLFIHKGHVANTSQSELLSTVNMWYPDQSGLVLSGASDGSLHAWRPVIS